MFIDAYEAQIARKQYTPDPAQYEAAQQFQLVFDHLTRHSRAKMLISDRLRRLKSGAPGATSGLWLWGSVGSGKTYLMDLFFNSLPLRKKRRMHFHRFMRHIHHKLKHMQDRRNPIDLLAARMAKKYKVLCIDEFFVSDITDAMILGGLLEGLFRHRVTVVATSNSAPDNLYEGGLQRERFLPAIESIKRHMTVFELATSCDYRLQHLDQAETYCLGANGIAEPVLLDHFRHLASDLDRKETTIEVEGRTIPVKRLSHDAIWFGFDDLCQSPRCVNDYIAIARCFRTVLISGIPVFEPSMDDSARRFIEMIDEFYDRNVTLIASAAAEPDQLYQGKRLKREFERTTSRLHEMRSQAYLGRSHRLH